MERLTMRDGDGYSLDHGNCPMRGQCSDSADCVDVLLDRLAAYEDTELTPEEIMKLKKELYLEGTYVCKVAGGGDKP